MRSKELSLCTIEEIKRELKKQGVTEVKIVSVKKEEKAIDINTYVMHFNTPKIPEKIKVGHTIERVEQYIQNLLQCYKYQQYGHNEDNCRGHEVCGEMWSTKSNCGSNHRCTQDLVRVGGKRGKY